MKRQSSERARLRKLRSVYRKRIAIWAIVMLIIGFILGIVADQFVFNKKDKAAPEVREIVVTPTPAATEDAGFEEPDMEGFVPDENQQEPDDDPKNRSILDTCSYIRAKCQVLCALARRARA